MDKIPPPAVGTPAEAETKIQVDRRRLEAMITGELPGESADAFFARVERTTGARVCWPSRLKIRAKTKKDPFIKLAGTSVGVEKAAQMIGGHLRVKREKATLKMEISHCLHSQIIGRGGRNTQQIMHDTGCHIHFPDSNKTLSPALPQAKNDQVSISGCAKDVERAREMLRAIGPLAVSVSIQLSLSRSNLCAIQPRLDPATLQQHFPQQQASAGEVGVQFSTNPAGHPPMLGSLHFVMRSNSRNELDMLRHFGRICQLIGVFPTGAELFCCSQFEIRPSALPSLSAVRWIAFRTNTQIQLNAQGLLVSGPLEGIFVARKFMTGLLPVSLHFEKPAQMPNPTSAMLRALERELDIQIGEKRRRKAVAGKAGGKEVVVVEEKEFIIGTYEANLFNAYLARNRLLQLNAEPSTASASSSSPSAGRLAAAAAGHGEEDQFPQDNDEAALMRSLCRQSLLADQRPPLPASIPFPPTCKTPPFPGEELMMAGNWKEGTIVGGGGTDKGGKIGGSGDTSLVEELLVVMADGGPKSPDPEESPIAAGLLAGAKSVNLAKGEFRKALDRERMMLKANQAIFNNSPLLDIGGAHQQQQHQLDRQNRPPTDLWSGYGFSTSLPVELLRMGGQFGGGIWPEGGGKPRGRPIVGRGAEDDLEEEAEEEMEGMEEKRSKGEKTLPPILLPQRENVPLFAKSQMLPERDGQQLAMGQMEAQHSSRKATALVHPRVAALQAGEQKKQQPKFTMSTESGLFEGNNNNGVPMPPPPPMRMLVDNGGGGLLPIPTINECPPPPAPAPPHSIQWDIRALCEPQQVLVQLGLADHVGPFREQEIDMQAFLLLDEQCLGTLGVNTLGARRKIMHAVHKLRESARRHGLYSL